MADDLVNRQQFVVRDLGTNSVTFFPSSANIVRDVKDITIKVSNAITPTLLESDV